MACRNCDAHGGVNNARTTHPHPAAAVERLVPLASVQQQQACEEAALLGHPSEQAQRQQVRQRHQDDACGHQPVGDEAQQVLQKLGKRLFRMLQWGLLEVRQRLLSVLQLGLKLLWGHAASALITLLENKHYKVYTQGF